MRLMTADKMINHAKKYKVYIYVRDGNLFCSMPNLDVVTPSLRKLLEIHKDVIEKHFGV